MYPFGGGDLISALTTYPELTDVTTMSLEHAGDPRRIWKVNAQQLKDSLAVIRRATSGLLVANDSKTENLMKAQRGDLPGQLSFFLIGLAVHGFEPVSVRYVNLNPDGSVHGVTAEEIAAVEGKEAKLLHAGWTTPDFSEAFDNVEIVFVKKGEDPRSGTRVHHHFARNMDDEHYIADVGLSKYLEGKGRICAMTKAASYLLWRDNFSKIRDYLLAHMEFMVSDLTCIPPKFAIAAGSEQQAFGHFKESFLGANPQYNEDFRKLWKTAQPLPFRYGYVDKLLQEHMMITCKASGDAKPAMRRSPPTRRNLPTRARPPRRPPRRPTRETGRQAPRVEKGRAALLQLAVLAVLCQLDGGADAGIPPLTPAMDLVAHTTRREFVTQLLDDGRHTRFGTDDKGAVNVWRPATYRPEGAVTIVYVHGFYNNSDSSFLEHHLSEQFRDSGRNAMFVVPESPSWRTDDVIWMDLDELLTAVEKQAKVPMPKGPVWIIAHSGAYRTAASWLKNPKIERVVLLDALYAADEDFRAWVKNQDNGTHRLTVVGYDTAQRVEWFLKQHPTALRLDDLPFLYDGLRPALASANPLVYVQSERPGPHGARHQRACTADADSFTEVTPEVSGCGVLAPSLG